MKRIGFVDNLKFVCALAVPLVMSSLGCGSAGPESIAVSGKVTFDGAALADGEIIFRDAAGEVRS